MEAKTKLDEDLDAIQDILENGGDMPNEETQTLQALKDAYMQMAPKRMVSTPSGIETFTSMAAPMAQNPYSNSQFSNAVTNAGKAIYGFSQGAAMRRAREDAKQGAPGPGIEELKTTAEIMKLMREGKAASGAAAKLENPFQMALGMYAQKNITLKRAMAQDYGKKLGATPEQLKKIDLQILAEERTPVLQQAIDELVTTGGISPATAAKLQQEGTAEEFNKMATELKNYNTARP